MFISLTADLHWGHGPRGDTATRELALHLRQNPPGLLLLGGDLGTADHFAECLELFADLPCPKALVPGNHDLWVEPDDARGDSLQLFQEHLPRIAKHFGFHYLDDGPLVIPKENLAIVGTVNWYDYSWSLEQMKGMLPDWEYRLRTKSFLRGRHNDGRFVRWPLDDVRFTQLVVERFAQHLEQALNQAERIVVMTHHPAFYGINFPRDAPPTTWDGFLWDALCGNRAIEEVLTRHADRISLVFSGHTHRARENVLGPIRGYNIGGDYHFKRMLTVDWPAASVTAQEFGDSTK